MPMVDRWSYATTGLDVAYRASAEPQVLYVRAELNEPDPDAVIPILMGRLEWCATMGALSGADFDPAASDMKVVSGPKRHGDAGASDEHLAWDLEVKGVSPFFARRLVEIVATGKLGKTLSIRGSLPLDDSPLSVRTAQVLASLDDKAAYMSAWPTPGFEFAHIDAGSGATVDVTLVDELTDELAEQIDIYLSHWNFYVGDYGKCQRI